MRSLKDFFYPLIAVVVLFGSLLIWFLFLPTVGTATTSMSGNVTGGAALWGFSWWGNGSVVMLLIVFMVVGVGLFRIGKEWLKSRFMR